MLDLTGIMFSSAMMLFVILRAVQLDRIVPWFQKLTHRPDPKTADRPAWTRRG
jgi:hypothetical protein